MRRRYDLAVLFAFGLVTLAAYPSAAACKSAADAVNVALKSGEDAKTAICLTSESLSELAKENDVSGK